MNEKESLELEIQRNESLQSLTNQSGWKYIQEIFLEEVNDAFEKILENKESLNELEARTTINAVDRIYSKIDNRIKILEKLKERYIKKFQ